MNTVFMLLAIYNKPRLTLAEFCHAICMSTKTGYYKRSAGDFSIPLAGDPLTAGDVADYLDALRDEGARNESG
jgi:hypothetical protein